MTDPAADPEEAAQAPTFSRGELLGGMPSRRAGTLLFAIEGRTARLSERSREAMARYLTERAEKERERAFLAALADARDKIAVTPQDLERYAPEWRPLVPHDADTTATLAASLGDKYRFRRRDVPRMSAALRLDEPAVGQAFQRLRGAPIDSIFTPSLSIGERARWLRGRFEQRLESLPPAVTAYALTLTELVGAGVVALPIAFAAVGPAGAVALLIAFGLLNALTVAALVEAVTRSGRMRFGSSYYGRFVAAYLGRSSSAAASLAFLLLNAFGVALMILGFGTTVGDATGIPAELWAAALAVAVVLILRRDSLGATVASVLVVGSINIVVLVAILVVAFGAFDAANFSSVTPGSGPGPAALLGLVFGTTLMAYYGHSSAANAAKVVLARDPGGRSLLSGNVLAILTGMVIYVLFVVATLGAVPAEELTGFAGTALTPLAEATGPLVTVLGLVFVALALGLSALHMGLGLANQVGEWLPRPADIHSSRAVALLADPGRRAIVKAVPVVAILVGVEALLITGTGSFTDILSFVGVITLPLISGLFPMLLLAAARKRGEYVPALTTGIVGSRAVIVLVSIFFMSALLVHGILIWDDTLPRLAALTTALMMAGVVGYAMRDHVFRPRLVVELRVDRGRPRRAVVSVVSAGERAGIPIRWVGADGSIHEGTDAVELGDAAEVTSVDVDVPPAVPTDVRTWVHRIDDEGESVAWPATVSMQRSGPVYPLEADDRGIADDHSDDAATRVTIEAAKVGRGGAGG